MVNATRVIDKVLLATQSITAAATASATSDVRGCDWATVRINFKAEVNTSAVGPTVVLSHSDTTNATDYATVTANRTEDLENAHELRYEVDLKSKKRYLKLAITAATHTTNDIVNCGATLSLSRNEQDPASTTAMQGSTNDAVVIC